MWCCFNLTINFLHVTRMESTAQAEMSLRDEIFQEDNVPKPADAPSKINEFIPVALLNNSKLPDVQALEPELAGFCEDLAPGLRMESGISCGNTSADLKESCIEEPVPDGVPCTDGASPALSGTNHHGYEVSLCSTASNLPEVAHKNDDKAAPSQLCTSANSASTTIADDCKDVSSKAIVTASESESLDFHCDDNNETGRAVIDEVNMITMEGNALSTGLEVSEERVVVKHEQHKREGISLFFPSLICKKYL